MKRLFTIIVLTVIILGYFFLFQNHEKLACDENYPLTEQYNQLSKDHTWKPDVIFGNDIMSYKNGMEDGIFVTHEESYNKAKDRNETFSYVSHYQNNKREGVSLSYQDGKLFGLSFAVQGKREGINLSFNSDLVPSLLEVYDNDKSIGMIVFWESGSIRGMEFDANNKVSEHDRSLYQNGQKGYVEIEEDGINYRVVYNQEGELLLKWPMDNDVCKAKFFNKGIRVDVPLYLDTKEFEVIYNKIKDTERGGA